MFVVVFLRNDQEITRLKDPGEQKTAIEPVFPLLKGYKIVVLGDREFCSVELGNWLREKRVYFCLRLKRDEFIQVEGEIWLQLQNLGLTPGVSLYFRGNEKLVKIGQPSCEGICGCRGIFVKGCPIFTISLLRESR